jgi:4-amino-4-deoxy-L-arabinose transferase-like glycosyltransferase
MRNFLKPQILLILALAFVVRIGYFFSGSGQSITSRAPWEYQKLAVHLLKDGVYSYDGKTPSAFRLPLYPLFLDGIYWTTRNTSYKATAQIFLIQILINCFSVFFLYQIAMSFFSSSTAVWASVLFALNPTQIGLIFTIGPETLQTLQCVLITWAALWTLKSPKLIQRWSILGLAIGFSLLAKSTFLVLPIFLILFFYFILKIRIPYKGIFMLLLCSYIPLLPWIIRNDRQLGRAVIFEDGMGWHALYQGTNGVRGIPDPDLPEPLKTYFFSKDPRIGPVSKKMALRQIKAHPWRYAQFCLERFDYIWFHGDWAEHALRLKGSFYDYVSSGAWFAAGERAFAKILELAFMSAALWGIYAGWAFPEAEILFAIVFYMNIHLLTQGEPRYTASVIPCLCILAVLGSKDIFSRIKKTS